MKEMKYIFLFICVLFGAVGIAQAQQLRRVHFEPDEIADASHDSIAEQRIFGNISIGGGAFSGFGTSFNYGFTNVNLMYKVSDRLNVGGGIGLSHGFGEADIHLHRFERSFAPRRKQADYLYLDGAYHVNDRMTVYASVFYQQGTLFPLYGDIDAYALGVSAAMRYRIGNKSYLGLYLQYLRSEGMPPFYGYGYDGLTGCGRNLIPMYSSPFACRQMSFDMVGF
ncbi:MAG: hypothetical protein IJ764_04765 [Bacteroidales bacterium]|nr:hypothetical protein [Bacteroidales bacterium]